MVHGSHRPFLEGTPLVCWFTVKDWSAQTSDLKGGLYQAFAAHLRIFQLGGLLWRDCSCQQFAENLHQLSFGTVGGRNPKQPPGIYKTRRKEWDIYMYLPYQLVFSPDFWTIPMMPEELLPSERLHARRLAFQRGREGMQFGDIWIM